MPDSSQENHHYHKQCGRDDGTDKNETIPPRRLHCFWTPTHSLLPLPPPWVILTHSFHRDTGLSYIDWKPHSQRSWCWTADNTIASNGFCSVVQTEGAFSAILLNPHIYSPPQITLRISASVWCSFPHLRGQPRVICFPRASSFKLIHYWNRLLWAEHKAIVSFQQIQWKDCLPPFTISRFLVAFTDLFTFPRVAQYSVRGAQGVNAPPRQPQQGLNACQPGVSSHRLLFLLLSRFMVAVAGKQLHGKVRWNI